MTPNSRRVLAGCAGVLACIAIWWLLVATGAVDRRVLLSPPELAQQAMALDWGSVAFNVWVSTQRVVAGALIGGVSGLSVGVLIGWNDRFRVLFNLPLELLRPIPPLAWIPLALIWFGIGDESKIFVIGLGCFFAMLTNTEKGIRDLDPALVRQGRSYDLRGIALICRVVLPGIRPELMVGASISTSLAFASLVAAEMLGADSGLGYMLMRGRLDGDFGMVLITIGIIAALAYLVDVAVRWLIVPHAEAYEG